MPAANPVVCGARTRSGGPCQRAPIAGRDRCRAHGGTTPRGVASTQFVHGRRSKDIPSRLTERYQDALVDEELLALRDDVALIDARLGDVLSRVDTGESGRIWKDLQQAWQQFTAPGDSDRAAAKRFDARILIGQLIEEGAADYEAWHDVRSLVDQRARLVSNERQRLVQLQQTITVEQAMAMLAAVVSTIKLHVSDEHALANISHDLGRLVAVQPVLAARSERPGDAGRRSPS
jgi:hypothetical protein